MTELLNYQIRIPSWAVGVFAVVFIAYMGFFTAQVKAQSVMQTKIEANEKKLEAKADQKEIDRIYDILDRIENKLDKQIDKQR